MREIIKEYVNKIELVLQEYNKYIKEATNSEKDILETKDQEEQDNKLLEHFVKVQYASLLYNEMGKTIERLVERCNVAAEQKIDLQLNEKEQKIIDGYLKQVHFLFTIDKGEIVSKEKDILKIMKNKSETLKHRAFLDQYIKQIKNNQQQ